MLELKESVLCVRYKEIPDVCTCRTLFPDVHLAVAVELQQNMCTVEDCSQRSNVSNPMS